MQKIRLLTFHNVHNYGALLQCYALYDELEKYGECKIIDYSSQIHDYRLIRRYRGWKNRLRAILRYFSLKKRYNLMHDFIEGFQCTESLNPVTFTKHSFNDSICVVGSDQIWACRPNNYDRVYFLGGITAKKKISYAASMGISVIPDELKLQVGSDLREFSAISVREKSVSELLKNTYDLYAQIVLDPVFLHKKDFWSKRGRAVKISGKYILVYFLEVPANARKILETLKQKTQLPVYAITTINSGLKYGADRDLISVGPREFLWLFEHAEFVVTSSFHGTAFSIIFEKQFYTLPKRDTAERMVDLLNSLDLQDRIVKTADDINVDTIDYCKINKTLDNFREKSKEFIKNALNSES